MLNLLAFDVPGLITFSYFESVVSQSQSSLGPYERFIFLIFHMFSFNGNEGSDNS